MSRTRVPFTAAIPQVNAGDPVECRNAYGEWVPMVAAGPARYDDAHACRFAGAVYLTVPVAVADEWHADGEGAHTINWPAEDVRIPDGAT